MNFTLTKGCIKDIIGGSNPPKPVLQLLGVKKIQQQSPQDARNERYRILLSDGVYQHAAMLATQLNNLAINGQLENKSVIQLNKYICNTIGDGRRVMIVLDLSMVARNIKEKLGNPVPFQPAPQPQQDSPTRPPQPTGAAAPPGGAGVRSPPPSFRGGFGVRQADRPSLSANSAFANRGSGGPGAPPSPAGSPSTSGSSSRIHPIAGLTPYQNRWTIRARVTNKSTVRTWSNARGQGKLFSMDLVDDSAEIRATAFNDQVDKFYDSIEVGKVYDISKGALKTANKQYTAITNDYEMSFNNGTEVTLCQEADTSAIPALKFDFKPIASLEQLEKDTHVDVIGVCKSFGEVGTVTVKSTSRELSKRELQLVDTSDRQVSLTLWGSEAEKFEGTNHPVIAIKGAKLSDFGGRSLSVLYSSTLQINPDIPQAHHLRGWFDSEGQQKEAQSISNQRGGPGGASSSPWKSFAEVREQNLGINSDKPDYFTNKATIIALRKENAMYMACPAEGCNKKLSDNGNQTYRCEKCGRDTSSYQWRLILSVNLADHTGNQWVTCFQESAEALLDTTAQKIGEFKDSGDDVGYDRIFSNANFKSFIFRMRIKMETFNDESRLKATVMQVSPINYHDYNQKLIEDIQALSLLK